MKSTLWADTIMFQTNTSKGKDINEINLKKVNKAIILFYTLSK